MSFLVEDIGGDEGDRTPDLMNAIHALSQLSYGPFIFDDLRSTRQGRERMNLETLCRQFLK